MLPHVESEHGNLPFHERAVLVGGAEHLELAARDGKPRPAAAEPGRPGCGQLLLERREAAERLLDRVGEGAARLTAAALARRRHDRPEQRVIVVAAPVVAHRGTDVLRHARDAAEQRLEALLVQRGMLVERRVQVAHVRLMMLAVVDLHRLGVDVRLQRGIVVGQERQSVLVGFFCGCGCLGHRRSPRVCDSVPM